MKLSLEFLYFELEGIEDCFFKKKLEAKRNCNLLREKLYVAWEKIFKILKDSFVVELSYYQFQLFKRITEKYPNLISKILKNEFNSKLDFHINVLKAYEKRYKDFRKGMIKYGEDLAKLRQILHDNTLDDGKNNSRQRLYLTKNW